MEHDCSQLESIGSLKRAAENLESAITRLDDRVNGTFQTIGEHIKESPEYRNRIAVIETIQKNLREEISAIKQGYWKASIIAGLVGGLLGKLTPELFNFLVKSVFANLK